MAIEQNGGDARSRLGTSPWPRLRSSFGNWGLSFS